MAKRASKSSQLSMEAAERCETFPVYGSIEAAIQAWDNPQSVLPSLVQLTTREKSANWQEISELVRQSELSESDLSAAQSAPGSSAVPIQKRHDESDDCGANTLTGPLTLSIIPDDTREAGGVDWLEYCCYGEFASETWTLVRESLCDAKRLAAKSEDGRCLLKTPDGKHVLSVLAGGKGRGYSYCAFNAQIDGIALGICDRRESGGSVISGKHGQPIVFVKATGLTCLVRGWKWVVERASEILGSMGFKWHNDAVSRLDICTDVVGLSVREFSLPFMEGRSIRLSRKWAMWGDGEFDGLETIRFGSTEGLTCRIYDKLAETKDDATKRALMRLVRWGIKNGEDDPGCATRVEFQLRREECKGQGLYAIADLELGLGKVMEYLTTKWLRFTQVVPDRENRHQDRAGVIDAWATIHEESKRWAVPQHGFNRYRRPTFPAEEKHLRAMNNGILARLLAGRNLLPSTKEACLIAVTGIIEADWRTIAAKTALRTMDMEDTIPGKGDKVKRAYVREGVPLDERLAGIAAIAGEM
jgi:hypothetical protein